MILFCVAPPLIEQGVVVIARHGGLVFPAMVRAGGKAKVCASMEHIEAEIAAHLEHSLQLVDNGAGLAAVMTLPPMVKPAVPKLTAHQWRARLAALHRPEIPPDVRAEIDHLKHIG